jgi:hypothetical protein
MTTSKNKWFVACVPLSFKKLKSVVHTPNNERFVPKGGLFKCLIDDVGQLEFKFMCLGVPKKLFRPTTKDELKKIIEKEEKQ